MPPLLHCMLVLIVLVAIAVHSNAWLLRGWTALTNFIGFISKSSDGWVYVLYSRMLPEQPETKTLQIAHVPEGCQAPVGEGTSDRPARTAQTLFSSLCEFCIFYAWRFTSALQRHNGLSASGTGQSVTAKVHSMCMITLQGNHRKRHQTGYSLCSGQNREC